MQAANERERERFGANIGHNQHEYMLHFINLYMIYLRKLKQREPMLLNHKWVNWLDAGWSKYPSNKYKERSKVLRYRP